MIIWLASYPKSGNTWLRSVLVSYYFTEDGNFNFEDLSRIPDYPNKNFIDAADFKNLKDGEVYKYWEKSQKIILQNKKAKFLKTHNIFGNINGVPFTKPDYTLGVIHIIRDPRNVITSIKNHLNFENYEKAFNYMISEDAFIKGQDSARFSFLGTWSAHYKSWSSINSQRRMTIKYEDMENNTYETFKSIVKYINKLLGIKNEINNDKLLKAISSTSFDKLSKGEKEGKFKENVFSNNNQKITFFNLGPKNKWEKLLPKDIAHKMNNYYKYDLNKLNY